MMVIVSKAEKAVREGGRATTLGKDIMSAFNNVRREGVIRALRQVQ